MAAHQIEEYVVSEVKTKKKEKISDDRSSLFSDVDEEKVYKSNSIVCEYDPTTNTSKLYRVNDRTGKKVFLKEYKGKVYKIKKEGLNTYIVVKDKNGKYGVIDHSGKVVVDFAFDDISFAKIPGAKKSVLRVSKKYKEGIVTLKGQEVLPCEYDSIDLTQSKYSAGKCKFFVQKRDDRPYNTFENWGVVDERGRVLLDFNYQHNGENGVHSYKRVKEFGKPLQKYLLVTDCSTRHCVYFNIEDKDFIASPQTRQKMDEFDKKVERKAQKLADSYDYDLSPAKVEKMDEDTRHAISFAVAVATGSPLAGLMANEILKD